MARIEPPRIDEVDAEIRHLCEESGRQAGVTEARIAAIDDETSDLLSPRERVAIRFAEKLAVDIGFGRFNDVVGIEPV